MILNGEDVQIQVRDYATCLHLPLVYLRYWDLLPVDSNLQGTRYAFSFVYKASSLLHLHCLSILNDWFVVSGNSFSAFSVSSFSKSDRLHSKSAKSRLLIIILLLVSGNVKPNPGPDAYKLCHTPEEFKSRAGLGIIHLNVRSLMSKLDMVKVWVKSTDADIVVLSETWLTNSTLDKDIGIEGYHVYRSDRPKKGGGVAIYIKCKFNTSIVLSKSVSKQFEFLALNLELSKNHYIRVIGCYRPPSATSEATSTLSNLLGQVICNETVIVGDLNWDWLTLASDTFKEQCVTLNLTQLTLLRGQIPNILRNHHSLI